MAYYRRLGEVPDKRHTQHRAPDGSLYHEELMGEEGFSSDSSLLYHRDSPSALTDARPWEPPAEDYRRNHPLLPRHLRPYALFPEGENGVDAVTGRRVLLGNADVRLSYAVADEPSPLYKDAIGDQCVYVEEGEAVVETVFGALSAGPGDYVVLPRGMIHRWVPSGQVRLYCIEAASHIAPPSRYLSRYGQLLEHAPYCERDLRAPAEPLLREGRDVEVHVRHRGGGTVHVHATHPFDVVGWDGCLYPYALSVHDFEPITGRVHQPPPVHQVFAGRNFVVCNFVPRKVDYHPLAVPVPYAHSNVDSDEVMFYCGGDYEARRGSGIERGSVSLHPGGHTHGPHPGVRERALGLEAVNELAVMVDTFAPLELGEGGAACADPDYAWTWTNVRR
ncbi:homogentisate 1,2-dioxygenase [Actinocorallia libanotica]|uniref:Homogentisate 1,2-dioxygenase n=1 Tax=Actinocorallia libanotica TaxID=46162 RepID=A0ABN1RSG6_9ACTN